MNLREFWAAEAAKLRDTSELLDTSRLLNSITSPNTNKDKVVVDTEGLLKKIINQIRWAHVHQTKVVVFPLPNAGKIEQLDMLVFRNRKPGYNTSFTGLRIENKVNYAVELNPRTYKKYKSGDRTCFMIHTITISIPTYDNQEERFEKYIFAQTDNTNIYTEEFSYFEKNTSLQKTATLATIQAEIVDIKNRLSKEKKLITLTDREHIILDLPIIMCKLGWVPGGVCMLNWIKGGGTLQFDWKWFMACEFSQEAEKKIKYQFKKAKYLADIFSSVAVPRNSYKHIESINLADGQKKTCGYGEFYRIKTNYGENAPLNCSIAVGLGDQLGTLDQWGAALGRYRLAVYIKGELVKEGDGQRVFTLQETIWRFADNFDYVDNPPDLGEIAKKPLKLKDLPSQPLGLWKHDLYDVQLPSKDLIEVGFYEGIRTDGYQYYLDNKTFQQLHPKIHTNKNYIGFLTISEEVQYLPDILLSNPKLPIGSKKP